MGVKRSRAVSVGLGAAFGAAAMILAFAPIARADDFSDILADVQAEQAAAQAAFEAASTDFAGGASGAPAGLAELFTGMDDDLFGVPDDLQVGTLDSIFDKPVIGSDVFEFHITAPDNYTDAVTEAQNVYNSGSTLLTDSANFMAMGDYADASMDHALAAIMVTEIPDEILIIGQLDSLLDMLPTF